MLYIAPVLERYSRKILVSSFFPYLSLLVWILPLLLLSSQQTSLMAHDEGLYAGRAKMMFDSGDWIHPWSNPHHKTPGYYWIIAYAYKLFGVSEFSVRIPSIIFGILCVLILYEISKIILDPIVSWLSAAIFSVEFLWLQYCRLGNPDVVMIFLVLLSILALLKAEKSPRNYDLLLGIAGLLLGLGFLIRSVMIFLPIIALFPYLVGENRRHHHLNNSYLYLGFIIGLIPTFIWLWLNFQHYGNGGVTDLFRFAMRLSSHERQGNGMLFYVWNVPLKSFPWFFFAIFGLILKLQNPVPKYQLLLVVFPIVLFGELSFFSTRLSHYSLCLYPFMAMFAAIGLNRLGEIYQLISNFPKLDQKSKSISAKEFILVRNFSYFWGLFGVLLLVSSVVITVTNANLMIYVRLGFVVGFSSFIVPIVFWRRYHAGFWILGCLIPAWLGLAVAGGSGFLNNYNPDFKTFVEQQANAQILKSSPVHFVDVRGKPEALMFFYTRISGIHTENAATLAPHSYAWISSQKLSQLSLRHKVIGKFQKYSLVQLSE
jgi:hypothetical protein